MGAIKSAICDGVITFLWIFCISSIGALTFVISSILQIQAGFASNLLIITFLISALVFVFNLIAHTLGGASFNPTGTAAFYAAGIGGDSLFSMALRLPAQAAGAVGAVLMVVEYMPSQYKHLIGGPSVKVDQHTAAIVEGVLTFLISFAVLWIFIQGPRSLVIKSFMLAVTTVTLVVIGSGYTGPAMNPANHKREILPIGTKLQFQINSGLGATAHLDALIQEGYALGAPQRSFWRDRRYGTRTMPILEA